jgi:hypothetical protein
MEVQGEPLLQYVCHCDDCQRACGKAFSCALYPARSVTTKRGEVDTLTVRTSPRTKCKSCGTILFNEVPGQEVVGVNGELLPENTFSPAFHSQCAYANAPIDDGLPHYKHTPALFGGSDELMEE